MANVEQTQKMIPFVTCEISLCQHVCELVVVSMNLIWILGSKLIRSNNQSSATLWVLETSLIVGLLPLMIILITVSLSSNTYNKASWCENCTFEGTRSKLLKTLNVPRDCWLGAWLASRQTTALSVLDHSDACSREELRRSDPINRQRETRPISIQRPKRWFRILLNCVKLKFVSYTSNLLEQMYDFRKCTVFLQKWLLNPQDLQQNRSLENSPSLHCFAILPTWQCCLYSHVWWMYDINRFRRLSQALVHFVIDRANLFTDHRISGLPIIRAKYKHFRTIWEHTCYNSPTDFISSSLKWWSSMQGVDTL